MSKRATRKRPNSVREEPNPLTITAPPELFARCFAADIVFGCIGPFLSLVDLVRLCSCDKRLYALMPVHWRVLGECQRLYGGQFQVTDKWIKHCVQVRNTQALRWVFDRALREYLGSDKEMRRQDALTCCMRVGLKAAFKTGYDDGVECVLEWRLAKLAPAIHNYDTGHMYNLFNCFGTHRSIADCIVLGLETGATHGQTAMVRRMLEKHWIGFVFPKDTSKLITSVEKENPPTIEWDRSKHWTLAHRLILGCVSCGDTINYPFFERLYESALQQQRQSHHNDWLAENWKKSLLMELLRFGRSTTFLPILRSQAKYSSDWDRPDQWWWYARQNLNPCMLLYVLDTMVHSSGEIGVFKEKLQDEYLTTESALRKAVSDLVCHLESKSLTKLIGKLQQRLILLRDLLIRPPFKCDWDEFRPTGRFENRYEWKWEPPK